MIAQVPFRLFALGAVLWGTPFITTLPQTFLLFGGVASKLHRSAPLKGKTSSGSSVLH